MITTMISLLAVLTAVPQDPQPQRPQPPAARAADVVSPEAVVDALYATISGPAGAKRDWQRLRSLFAADGRMVAMVKAKDGAMRPFVLTVDDYVRRAGASLERDGFFELEIARRTQRFGDIAHVFSSYECKRARDDARPFLRGINSVQLVKAGDRWTVLQILWEQETDAGPIPPEFLVVGGEAKAPVAALPELQVNMVGSDLLLELMQQWGAGYRGDATLKVKVSGGGTGSGFQAFAVGKAGLTVASRRLEDAELTKARESGSEPLEVCIGYCAAAIGVSPDNPIASLDVGQLRGIASGNAAVAVWSKCGAVMPAGVADDIQLGLSTPGALWSFAFRQTVLDGKRPEVGQVCKADEVLAFVRERRNSLLVLSGEGAPGVRLVPIAAAKGGVAVLPEAATCKDGSYPLSVPLYVYFRDEQSGRVKRFVRWLTTDDGRALLAKHSIVPAR